MVTQKDIAQHVGISRSTVAQVLNNIGRVNPETRERVLQGAKELGYRPNPLARALATGKTHTLAFWFYPMLDPFSASMANKLQMLVPPYGLVLINLGLYKPGWDECAEDFPPAEWPVDGIFAFRTGALPQRIMERRAGEPPIVWMEYDRVPPECNADESDAVIITMRRGCEDAVRHLVKTRERVAMLGLDVVVENPADGRTLAYESVLREAGRQPEYIAVPLVRPFAAHAKRAIKDYVRQHGCPDAIFCASDDQTPAVHSGLAEMGYRVPEDVALVGFDGLEHTEYHVPSLSTVVQPFDAMCQTAWQFMQNRLNNPDAPRQYAELEMTFAARESSRAE